MKNLVRGGVILSLIGMFVVFIYAQSGTKTALNIAKNSQPQLNNIEEDKFGVWPGSNFNKSPLSKVNEVSITLKKILKKRQFYVVLLPLRIGACTLIWVRNGNNWQILYAETICE